LDNAFLNRLQERIEAKPLLTHPFYQAWRAGELTVDDLRMYAAQYYFFEASFPRFLSAIHSRCPHQAVRQSILDNLWDEEHGELNHRAMWLDFAAGLGLDRGQVEFSPIHPKTQELLDTYFQACTEGTFQEGLAAVYAYEAQVPQVAVEKIRGLKEFYDMDDPTALKFFEVHGVLDEDHSQKEAEGIVRQTSKEDEDAVEAALQAALDAWWGFLDGVNEQRYSMATAD
jgi:pyrroloquinoline-quinone synthase